MKQVIYLAVLLASLAVAPNVAEAGCVGCHGGVVVVRRPYAPVVAVGYVRYATPYYGYRFAGYGFPYAYGPYRRHVRRVYRRAFRRGYYW